MEGESIQNLHRDMQMESELGDSNGIFEVEDEKDCDIKKQLADMESRMRAVEEALLGKKCVDPSKFITKQEMAGMIECAVGQGSETFGVSRSFLKKVLNEQFNVPLTTYYNKKISYVLQRGINTESLAYDSAHHLYKLKK